MSPVAFRIMLRAILSFFLSWCITYASFAAPVQAQAKKVFTLAILDLVPNGVSQVEATGISDKLRIHISRLTKSPEYIKTNGKDWYSVVERTQMNKILEQYTVQNTCVSDSCAIEFGKMLQVDRIVLGSISLVGKTYSVTSRIVDVETGRALAEADGQYKGSIDRVLNRVVVQVGYDLLQVEKKKSHKTLYMLAGAAAAGAATYFSFQHPDEKKPPSSSGILWFDSPSYPDEP